MYKQIVIFLSFIFVVFPVYSSSQKNTNFEYKIYTIKEGRLYTDRINDTAVIAKNGGWIVVGHHIAGTAGDGQRQSSDHDNTHRLNSVVPICLQYTRAQGYRPASVSQVSKR